MAKTTFLDFEIHLRDEARVLELQGNPPGETSTQGSGATAQKAIIRAPLGAAEEFKGDNGGVALPLIAAFGTIPVPTTGAYIYSRWFSAGNPEWGAMFPVDAATFVRKSGGWFGIPALFGNTERYYWRGVFVYDPPLEQGDPGGGGLDRQIMMKRRWIDPAPGNMFENREAFGISEMSRDAGAWVDTFGYANAEQAYARTMTMTDFTGGLANQVRCSWERLYIRLRKKGTSTLVWRAGGTVDASHNIQLNFNPAGQLSLFNNGVLVGSTEAFDIDRWYKVDIAFCFGDGGAGFAPDDHTGGGAFPGARANLFVDGFQALSFTPAAGVGLGNTSFHLTSRIGPSAATETTLYDVGFWMNARNPIVFNGIDFMNGSRAVALRPKAFAAGHANWDGDIRLLSQHPRLFQYSAPLTAEGLTSVTPLAELQVETDAARALIVPGSIGVAGIMVCHRGHWGLAAQGQLGYKAGAAARVVETMGANGLGSDNGTQDQPTHQRFMYAPNPGFYPVDPTTIVPFELHRVKGNEAQLARTYQLQAVAELIGIFRDSDYPVDFDENLKYPIAQRGYHNAPYPQSPWAQSAAPPSSPVVIKSGTYVGNGTGQDLLFPAPVNWIWIRKATGAGNPTMVRWWSSMLAPSVGGMKQPHGFLVPNFDQDPDFVPVDVEDTQQTRFRVRIAGSNLETNRNGDTYHYTAVMDPGMRFLLNTAIVADDDALPYTHPLIVASFTPLAALILEQRQGNYGAIEMFFKGPGHAANAMNRLDAAGANNNGISFGAGEIAMQAAFGAEAANKHAVIAAMRSDDGSSDPGVHRVFGFGSYVGNGAASRDIVHTVPGVSGRRPMWILVAPNGATGYVKDCTMPATEAYAVHSGVISNTAITGAAINQFTVGATLNGNGVTYHYMIIWGKETAGNGGMSECGEIWPVDPDPPKCIRIYDPVTKTWIEPPGGCDPGDPEPPDTPPDDPGGGNPPGNPGGGADDMGTDLASVCKPFTTRLANIALAKIGISRRVVNLANTAAVAWVSTRHYEIADAVTVGATTYYCILAHVNKTPPNATYWSTVLPAVDSTVEAEQVRLHWAHAVKQTLRDFPWPFATRHAALALVSGTATVPYNRDWRYVYRQPSDCVFERRIAVIRSGAVDPTPPPFALTFDSTGALIATHEVSPILEYTARPECTASQGDPLFVEAFTWKLAQLMAPALSKMQDREKFCKDAYEECVFVKAPAVLKPGNPGMRPTTTPDTLTTHQAANVAAVNRGLVRIGARTIANMLSEQSREAEAVRLIFEAELRSTLRDYAWPFCTAYAKELELVRGPLYDDVVLGAWSSTITYEEGDLVKVGTTAYRALRQTIGDDPILVASASDWDAEPFDDEDANPDWVYAYRVPASCVAVRRIVQPGVKRGFDPDPPAFRMGHDSRGALLFTNEENPTIEYTDRIAGVVYFADDLFRDAFAWRMAAALAPSIAQTDLAIPEQHGRGPEQRPKERKPTEAQLRERVALYAMQQYRLAINKAQASAGNEQQPQDRDGFGDAEWIRGRE